MMVLQKLSSFNRRSVACDPPLRTRILSSSGALTVLLHCPSVYRLGISHYQ